jgi:5-methylcytosine-specific restriction endonuclease McrA
MRYMITRFFKLEMGLNFFTTDISEQEVKRERDKSRELRRSRWWQNRLALGVCHWCGGSFPPEELTMDHVIPLARGGKASRNNVVPSCKECNSRKKYLLPMEWDEYLNNLRASE